MNDQDSNPVQEDPRLSAVLDTIDNAARRYASRFGIERLREEVHAESVARVLSLINDARPPFADAEDADAIDHMQRFTHGLVANVAREALRGRLRHAHVPLEERATACASLRATPHTPEQTVELEESISTALEKFRSLSSDVRETIIAEEIIQNQYASGDADRLCRSCEVSFQRVWEMIENRRSGRWTAEAWRQRVHRSRTKARAAVGALAAFTLGIAMAFGAIALAPGTSGPESPAPVVDNGSTQNGKMCRTSAPDLRLASTQNGSHGTSMGGDGAGGDGTPVV